MFEHVADGGGAGGDEPSGGVGGGESALAGVLLHTGHGMGRCAGKLLGVGKEVVPGLFYMADVGIIL